MEVGEEPLLTTEQMTEWYRVGLDALALAVKLASSAHDARRAVAGVYTSAPVCVLVHDASDAVGYHPHPDTTRQDVALVKSALASVLGVAPVSLEGRFGPGPEWVKVGYSPVLRAAGQLAGFFPGQDGGLPLSPSPVRSMLTTGLLGAGLGYAGGAAAEQLMPEKWRRGRLRNTLAALGGAAGAAPGAVWGAANLRQGRPFNDNSLLNTAPDAEPGLFPKGAGFEPGGAYRAAASVASAARWAAGGELLKEAFDTIAMPWELAMRPGPTPLDVNIDAMGRTLWDAGASPQLAGATMGALAAAQQMPGGREDEPGWVTPAQMASLATHMGAGYVSGAIVGGTLGLLTGMPESAQNTLKRTGMYLGVVRAVLPRLFGQ